MCAETMFSDIRQLQSLYVVPVPNTINTWAEPQNALGVTPNRVANSNEMPGNNSCAPAFMETAPTTCSAPRTRTVLEARYR